MSQSTNFRDEVLAIVESIPRGRVMTYGQIAAMCGRPMAARIVGGIAHAGPTNLPWQRVVKKDGGLAEGYPGGVAGHAHALALDGVELRDGKVDVKKYLWQAV